MPPDAIMPCHCHLRHTPLAMPFSLPFHYLQLLFADDAFRHAFTQARDMLLFRYFMLPLLPLFSA